jgi:hypothetical protein
MSTTYTPSVQLGQPASGDRVWNVPLNANTTQLDAQNALGDLCVTTTEVPSASLNVKVSSGLYQKQDGTVGSYTGVSSTGLTASSTNYLYLDLTASGALTINTTGFPTTAQVRLAQVVTTGTVISSITDARVAFTVLGSVLDGTALPIGSSSGYQIGTVSTQKIGFLGATPAAQQTGGSATASGSYTSTEQGMLQKAYNALRTFGFLS